MSDNRGNHVAFFFTNLLIAGTVWLKMNAAGVLFCNTVFHKLLATVSNI